jgi:hypothetical protein
MIQAILEEIYLCRRIERFIEKSKLKKSNEPRVFKKYVPKNRMKLKLITEGKARNVKTHLILT